MQLFYVPEIESTLCLPEEEAIHCFKVLRKKAGETISVIDGKGGLYTCSILSDQPKNNTLEILSQEKEFGKRDKYIHVAIAPTKNMDRMEWFVEKATEIGVDEISFIQCEHSERKVLKMDRLYKKAISAMKQSVKAYLPVLHDLSGMEEFVKNCSNPTRLIAHLHTDTVPIQSFTADTNICVLIGPEGDFSSDEIDLAMENGFTSVTLGNSRLRTETAGMAVCVHLT